MADCYSGQLRSKVAEPICSYCSVFIPVSGVRDSLSLGFLENVDI